MIISASPNRAREFSETKKSVFDKKISFKKLLPLVVSLASQGLLI